MKGIRITRVKPISIGSSSPSSIELTNQHLTTIVSFNASSENNANRILTSETSKRRSSSVTRDFSTVHIKRVGSVPNIPNSYTESTKTDNVFKSFDNKNKDRYLGIRVRRVSVPKENNSQYPARTKSCDDFLQDDIRLEPVDTLTKVNDPFNRSSSSKTNSDTISVSSPTLTSSLSKTDLLYNNNEMTKKQCKNRNDDHSSSSKFELGTIERVRRKQREKRRKVWRLACLLLSCLLCLGLLAAAITTALLLTLLRQPTTSTSSTTVLSTTSTSTTSTTDTTSTSTTSTESTTIIACNFSTVGPLQAFDTSAPTTWTMYSVAFTATSTSTSIRFSSATDQASKDWYVDNVSVVENGSTGTNLLLNGNFESGSSVGWNMYSCSSACSASIISSPNCEGGSGTCYHNACIPSSNIQFLEQYFTTTIGVTYNVTFSVLKGGSGLGSGTAMYVNAIS